MNFSEWFKTMLAGLVGTAIGIVITFGAQNMVDKAQKRRTEKLSAMMVLSNINDYVMSLRNTVAFLDEMDSLFLYVSSLDSEDLLDADTVLLADFCNFFPSANYNVRDRTAERIFSSSFAVWENIASPDFISNVGRCFSLIDYMESMTLEMEKRKEDLFRNVCGRMAQVRFRVRFGPRSDGIGGDPLFHGVLSQYLLSRHEAFPFHA